MNRELEMEICLVEQGYFIMLENKVHLDFVDLMMVYELLYEEQNE